MEFKFTIQPYQAEATRAVTNVFAGQPFVDAFGQTYLRDRGCPGVRVSPQKAIRALDLYDDDGLGYRNADVVLSQKDLLQNIRNIQITNGIAPQSSLACGNGLCELDVEMETGTGKTYVYTKTMYELNRLYGWSKFIIVVPSVAIREGVAKSLATTEQHFLGQYGKRIWSFVYNSNHLDDLDGFASRNDISCMIVNMQAFNTSFNEAKSRGEGRKGDKGARKMFSEDDDFGSRRPIDVLAATRPIIILDEPQRMGGPATQAGIAQFNPLFCLNYSATHKTKHNTVYALDPLDAYNQRLVKRIAVKGFELKGLRGTDGYLYLQDFKLSFSQPPKAVIEYKKLSASGKVVKRTGTFGASDSLYEASGGLEAYRDCVIAPGNDGIVPDQNGQLGHVRFLNNLVLHRGQVYGDSSEADMVRVQIRETIKSHLEKEEALFKRGIKCLSLFFIDEVAKYRVYEEGGSEGVGEYGAIFEEEYRAAVNERLSHPTLDDETDGAYLRYLRRDDAHDVHRGYFSVDKQGHMINSKKARGSDSSDDITAYDLILKNKERLLSFEEPTRFIFSHSALREGWDNPNVFQICTLKHSDSDTTKRQEVGRGLRLCVNSKGVRQDLGVLGEDDVHKVNVLTVIASESYDSFVGDLQKDMRAELRERPKTVNEGYLMQVLATRVDMRGRSKGEQEKVAHEAYFFLVKNDLIDSSGQATEKFREHGLAADVSQLPEALQPMAEAIEHSVRATYDAEVFSSMVTNDLGAKVTRNPLNKNFHRREFQELWKRINHKYAYTVSFDQDELRRKAIANIDKNLAVSCPTYTLVQGYQEAYADASHVEGSSHFGAELSRETHGLAGAAASGVRYDLVGRVAEAASVTRRTAAYVLQHMSPVKFALFAQNPEEFIQKVGAAIVEEKARMVVEHISYNKTDECYESTIFTESMPESADKAFRASKSIQDYVICDGTAAKSVERRFAEDLDSAAEVCVYAKLPRDFKIPTPVGNYAPDWTIAFKEDSGVRHLFFVAETKGSLSSLDLRGVEECKIECAKKLFNEMSGEDVYYHHVTSYDDLLEAVRKL